MALIVEDGTLVAGANSYVSVADVQAFAADRGFVLPTDNAVLTQLVIRAADYIETFEWRFKGERTSPTQAISWPRQNVGLNGAIVDPNTIPQGVKNAQMQGVIELTTSEDLSPNITEYAAELERVDVIEVRYATGGSTGGGAATPEMSPIFTKIVAYLYPLFRYQIGQLKVLRA